MTFDQYIVNPMGVKNSVFSNREMYRNLYTEKLDKILVREVGKVNYTLYKSKGEYYVHLKIPSEVIEKFYYDVVIHFYTDKIEAESSRSLKDYYVKFYSNDPSFVYTFAYAMLSNDMFIRDLVPRMSKEAVKKAATERNPKNEVGYVKSIYFAYLVMKNYSLFEKINYETYGTVYTKRNLLNEIEHADDKISKRQEEATKKSKKKKKEKIMDTYRDMRTPTNVSNRSVSNIGNTGIIGKTGIASRIKKTTKIKKL